MQKDLSFILLVFAGIVLIALILFSLRARWSKRYQQTPDADPEIMDDSFDVITKTPHNFDQRVTNRVVEPIIDDTLIRRADNATKLAAATGWITKSKIANKSEEGISEKPSNKYKKPIEPFHKPERIIKTAKPEAEFEVIVKKKEPIQAVKTKQAPQVIIFSILPKRDEEGVPAKFFGYELFQTLLSVNFSFGAMSIFHRHEKGEGEGKILFSLAQATEPGTFDINNMGACECTGLTLFMQLSGPEHNLKNFELMLQTAAQIAEDLNAILADGKRQPLQQSVIDQYRKQVAYHANQYQKLGVV